MRVGGLVVVYAVTAGCLKANPHVCCESADDCASIGAPTDMQGCSLGLVCSDHRCSLPPDAAPPECTSNSDCNSPRAVCGPAQTCVECNSSADCPTTSPVCATGAHACRACAADAECASGACDDTTGLCVAETDIAYASPAGTSAASCSQHDPCSVQRAFAVASGARQTVVLAPGGYTGNLSVSNTTVHLRGAGATLTTTAGDALTVLDSGHLEVRDLTIVSSASNANAILCRSLNGVSQPTLEASGVHIDTAYAGLSLRHCQATMKRSSIRGTVNGPSVVSAIETSNAKIEDSVVSGTPYLVVSADNSIVQFVNSVVGPSATPVTDGFVAAGGAVVLSFSTVFNTRITCSGSISCVNAPTNGVCLQSSIAANLAPGAPTSVITGCSATYSLLFPQSVGLLGSGNKLDVNPVFVDPNNGDLHLAANSPAIDAADPTTTVTTDIEGTMRPVGPAPDIGAYERH